MSGKRTVVEIGALAPLDAKAAKVLGGGEHWKPLRKYDPRFVREEEGALAFTPFTTGHGDITGQRFGRLVVKGLSVIQNKKKPANWVVRCDCGAYEHRKRKALVNPAGIREARMCRQCVYLEDIRAGRHKRVGPFNKDIEPPA
jgi:hypothetical protein